MNTVNGYVLFPHNGWATGQPLKWSRTWQTGVATGISGAEQRSALRAWPRHKLGCTLVAASLQERARLDARVDAALKTGYACLPFFGKGCALSAAARAGAQSLTLQTVTPWPWATGDYAILFADDETFDVVQVTSVVGTTLAFSLQPLAFSWSSGSIAWPLLFGKFTADVETGHSQWYAAWAITIEQLLAERTAQLGVPAPTPPGIGQQRIAKTNQIA